MTAASPSLSDDAALIGRALRGDDESLNSLYSRHWSAFLACAHAQWQRDRDEAQDLCQVACLKSVAHLSALRDRAQFRAWVMGFIVNEARNWRRIREIPGTGSSAATLDEVESMTAAPPSPLTQAESEFLLAELASVTRRLAGRVREVAEFMLDRFREASELPTVEQIAERFALSHGTSERARDSARREWRMTLRRYGFEEYLHE